MRRLILAILGLLCLTTAGYSQTAIQGWCEKGNTSVQTQGLNSTTTVQGSFPSCTVTVFDAGTSNLSTIFSDSVGTPKPNPFTATSTGYYQFFANNGSYSVQLSGSVTTFLQYSFIKISNASAGIGGSGTTGFLPVFTASGSIGNSVAQQLTSTENAVQVLKGGGFPGQLDLQASGNTNFVGLRAPASPAASIAYDLPPADGSNGQAIITDGSKHLSFGNPIAAACATCLTSVAVVPANQIVAGSDGVRGLQPIGSVGTTTTLLHGNAAGLPTYGPVALATDVSGQLPGANGGTGVNNAGLTITLGGNVATGGTVTFSGAFATTFTVSGATSITIPAVTDTMLTLAAVQTPTNKTFSSSTNVLGGVTMTLGGDATGDVYTRVGGVLTRVPIGTPGQFLGISAGVPAWATPTGSGTVNAGTTSQMAYYPGAGTAVSPLTWFLSNNTTQAVTITGLAVAGGVNLFNITSGAHTVMASNVPNVIDNGATVTFSAASTAEQDFWDIKQSTIAGSAATKTVVLASTFTVEGAPIVGANAAITTPLAVLIKDGGFRVTSTAGDQMTWFNANPALTGLADLYIQPIFSDANGRTVGQMNQPTRGTLSGGATNRFFQSYSCKQGDTGTEIAAGTHGVFSCYEVANITSLQNTADASEENHGIGITMSAGGTLGAQGLAVTLTSVVGNTNHVRGAIFNVNQNGTEDAIKSSGVVVTSSGTNNASYAYNVLVGAKFINALQAAGLPLEDVGQINFGATSGTDTGFNIVGSTAAAGLTFNPGAISTSGAEKPYWTYGAGTLTVTGATAQERFVDYKAPTITGAFTTTTAVTFDVEGPPVAAGGGTITTPLAFQVEAGNSRFLGLVTVNQSSLVSGSTATMNIAGTLTNSNAGNSDPLSSVTYTTTDNSATAELLMISYNNTLINSHVGGGVLANARNIQINDNTSVGTTITALDSIYINNGSVTSGTVTTSVGVHIATMQGTTKIGIQDDTNSYWKLGVTTQGTLGGAPYNAAAGGSMIFCSDCKNQGDGAPPAVGAVCVGAGTGAVALRENGNWRCF